MNVRMTAGAFRFLARKGAETDREDAGVVRSDARDRPAMGNKPMSVLSTLRHLDMMSGRMRQKIGSAQQSPVAGDALKLYAKHRLISFSRVLFHRRARIRSGLRGLLIGSQRISQQKTNSNAAQHLLGALVKQRFRRGGLSCIRVSWDM